MLDIDGYAHPISYILCCVSKPKLTAKQYHVTISQALSAVKYSG
jgi:hypothetical protein